MLVNGDWIAVSDHAIQYRTLLGDTGEIAGGHWCGEIRLMEDETVRYSTHCAILPPNAATLIRLPVVPSESGVQPVPHTASAKFAADNGTPRPREP